MLHLVVIAGPDTGARFEFARRETVVVGRGADCGVVLSDASVSRVHCRLITDGERVHLQDLGSRWGTMVNGEPAQSATLTPGDVVALGDTEFRVESVTKDGTVVARPNPRATRFESPTSPVPGRAPRPRVTVPEAAATEDDDGPDDVGDEAVPEAPNEPADQPPPRPPRIRNVEALAGELFLRYRVGAVVARARSGIVFRALDTRQDRTVALKVFHPGFLPNLRATERFLRGVRTMMPLEHDNLVKLHSAGRTRGVCFTVSEFVDGQSVRELIGQVGVAGMLDWRHAWRIAVGVAQALEYAHERGIIHRNVLPSNILVRKSDQAIKLGDLMLAKALEDAGADQITRPGEIVGDASYVSPEQLTTDRPADARSDLYSLGAALYAVLAGRPPFEGTLPEIVLRARTETPEPPTRRHLGIPSLFEGMVMRLLARRPEERFQSATALLNDLHRIGKYLKLE